MAAALGAVDELIREYLLYKGFVQTLRAFDQDRREDKDKGLKVNRIVDYILTAVNRSDFNALQSFWNHLSKRFFSRLNHDLVNTAHKLESTILKLFLITAHRNGRHEEIKSFFERMAGVLHDRRDWKEWFALPYTKTPEQHSTFKLYYSKEWYDAFVVSLFNFFSVIFNGLPLPSLLQFESEHQRMQALVTENSLLHNQLANTKEELLATEATVQRLEARLAQSVAHVSAVGRSHSVSKTSKPLSAIKGAQKKAALTTQERNFDIEVGRKKDTSVSPQMYSPPEELLMDQSRHSSEEKTFPLTPSNDMTPTKHEIDHVTTKYDLDTNHGMDESASLAAKAVSDLITPIPFLVVDQYVYKEHHSPITHCKFSPSALHVASVDTDGTLRVWEPSTSSLNTKSCCKFSKLDLLSLDWIHHGGSDNLLMLGFSSCHVKLFDVASSMPLWEFDVDKKYPRIQAVACSPSTPVFAVSSVGSLSHHSQTITSKLTFGLTSPTLPSQLMKPNEMLMMTKRPHSLSSPHGLYEPTPGELTIWDVNVQKIQSVLPLNPPTAINCMCFNHNSNLLVTGGVDGMIRLFDVVQGDCLCGWTAHHGEVYNIQFSSDETTVYSIGEDGNFCQWSILRSTEKIAQYHIHQDAANPAKQWVSDHRGYFPSTSSGNLFAFESEDKYVLTCSPNEGLIYQVGEFGTLTRVLSLSDHEGPVTCVDWVPGRRSYSTCVTGSVDSTISVVNLLKETVD